jgi:hypothetical protein
MNSPRIIATSVLAGLALAAASPSVSFDGLVSEAGAATTATAAAKKKCRKGYARKRVNGKVRCVKKRRPRSAPQSAPSAPASTVTTDLAAVRQQMLGTLWYWTRFDQAGTGGTTDRAHVNLCADGTLRLRRSSTTEDGGSNSYTVIIEDLSSAWEVTSGSYDAATGDLEATISSVSEQRREHTARGYEFSQPGEAFTYKIARRGSDVFLDDQPAFQIQEEPLCRYES